MVTRQKVCVAPISVPNSEAEEIFASGTGTRKVAINWVSLKSSGTPQMNKQLISILHLVAVGVLAVSKILAWVGDEHPAMAPTPNHYFIIVPGQPHAATQRLVRSDFSPSFGRCDSRVVDRDLSADAAGFAREESPGNLHRRWLPRDRFPPKPPVGKYDLGC